MKLPERLARRKGRGFHSAFATSFALEFAAFEEVMLPQLSAGGATNVLLIADGRMATMALSDGSALPETLGREYLLHSPPVADGVFHPKVILQVGREGGRCFVSSANVTGAGLGGNVEIAVEIECGIEPGPEREIVQAAWRYVDALVPSEAGAAREAVAWARERARWLDEPGSAERLHVLQDGTALAFLARPGGAEGIAAPSPASSAKGRSSDWSSSAPTGTRGWRPSPRWSGRCGQIARRSSWTSIGTSSRSTRRCRRIATS